jgi:hypothetical protein
MIQYSLLGRTAASTCLNTTFRGLALSPSSDKTANQAVFPADGDDARPRNVVFKLVDAAVHPRRLIILSVVIYGYGTWPVTLREEQRQGIQE